jgi:hypothetical protein
MPSLRYLKVYLYHHNRSSWNDLSLPQLTKMACLLLVSQHVDLESLARAASNLVYFYLHIEPYSGQFTRDFFETHGFTSSEVKRVHVQMTFERNINSGILELLPSVTVQRQKLLKEKLNEGRDSHEYSIVRKYFDFI